jgi:hypothetical protein
VAIISSARQKASDRDIFVDHLPVQAGSADLDLATLCRSCVQEARKPRERHAERPPVGQVDPYHVFVKADVSWRKGHVLDCSPDGARRNPGKRHR